MLVAEIAASEGCELSGGATAPGSADVGSDLGEMAGIGRIGLTAVNAPGELIGGSDVVIEFSHAGGDRFAHAAVAAEHGTPIVIGTTGLSAAEAAAVRAAAKRIPIVWAANTSLGINLLLGLVEQVAARLGPDWDIEIMEMHHHGKVDAPSGTALALGRAAAAGRGTNLDAVAQRGRDGITGARRSGDIGFASLRGGDAVGDHHVIFAGAGERLELSHRATNRAIYAKGAVRAARWVIGKPPGLYGMKEVLGLVSAEPHEPGHRIFDRSGSLGGPSWRDLMGEGRAALRAHLRRPALAAGRVPRGDGHPVIVLPAFLCSDAMTRGFRDWLAALGYAVEGWGGGVNLGPTAAAVHGRGSPAAAQHRAERPPGQPRRLQSRRRPRPSARQRAPGSGAAGYHHLQPVPPADREPARAALSGADPVATAVRHLLAAHLTAPPPVPTTAITYTPRDGVVAWRSCIDDPGENRENVAVDGAHTTMLANPRALHVIAERLARP